MIPVGSNLYLGDISSLSSLSSHPRITATLSLLTPPHSSYPSLHTLPYNLNHLCIPLSDTPTASLLSILPAALAFIHAHATPSTAILIHCLHGRSRSASVALAYLLSIFPNTTTSPEVLVKAALQQLHKAYPLASPSEFFLRQLIAFAERLPLSPDRYTFPGDPVWRLTAGLRERAELSHCFLHAWPQPSASDALSWEMLLLPDPNRQDAVALCRKCRIPLLSAAALDACDRGTVRASAVVDVMPVKWIGKCVEKEQGRAKGRLRCPGCQAKVGCFDQTGRDGLPSFAVTTSTVDLIAQQAFAFENL